MKVLLQGPMKGSYSLAIVNRNLAKIISVTADLYLAPNECDCVSDESFVKDGLQDLLSKEIPSEIDLHLKNDWPPTVADMRGRANAYIGYAWEETRFPPEYIAGFNKLNFVCVTSDSTAKALLSSGLSVPVFNIGNGVSIPAPSGRLALIRALIPNFGKYSTKFLHVSSGFWRKGVDLLIKAFVEGFASRDDVCLILKTFNNPDNIIELELAKYDRHSTRNIILISADFEHEDLFELYRLADCIVLPSRGEGFSLPAAEALALGKPVITTGFGGVLEFCTPENCLLTDYKLIASRTHVAPVGSLIAEPNFDDLKQFLQQAVEAPESLPPKASAEILDVFAWESVGKRLRRALTESLNAIPPAGVTIITTWNEKCGLAEYSRNMRDALSKRGVNVRIEARAIPADSVIGVDDGAVTRSWTPHEKGTSAQLRRIISTRAREFLVLQHHLGYWSEAKVAEFIMEVRAAGAQGMIIAHNAREWRGPFHKEVLRCEDVVTIVVHNEKDLAHLADLGFRDVHFFPHPLVEHPAAFLSADAQRDPHVMTFGFIMPHKGFDELIHAMALLSEDIPSLRLTVLGASQNTIKAEHAYYHLMDLISVYGLHGRVRIDTGFLTAEQVFKALQFADLCVLPYRDSREGASGALRSCLSAGRPMLISDSPIFAEVPRQLPRFASGDPIDLALKIKGILSEDVNRTQLQQHVNALVQQYSWSNMIAEIIGVIRYRMGLGYQDLTLADRRMFASNDTREPANVG